MRIFLAVSLLVTMSPCLLAQSGGSDVSCVSNPSLLRIEAEKPDVFITYEKTFPFTNSKGDNYKVYWLTIHNNLKGDISFLIYDESVSASGKQGIHYWIDDTKCEQCISEEPKREIPIGYPPLDISPYFRLKSGASFSFGVPDFHLIEATKLKILFNYPWEVGREYEVAKRPSHFVYFYASELPNQNKEVNSIR
ncbi:MAG TPA: hypothetical protein VMM38_10925 [Aridibacter sp.]|nr:hypothetical protein [Aridibacter sp.]